MRATANLVAAFLFAVCNPASAQTWVEFRPAGAGFRIELPGKPKVTSETRNTGSGPVPTTTAVVEVGKTMAFVVMYSQFTEKQLGGRSLDRMLDDARDGSVGKRRLRAEQKLTIGDHPARRLIIDADDGMVFLSQLVMIETQLNQAIFVSTAKGGENSAEAKRFVGSFAVVER